MPPRVVKRGAAAGGPKRAGRGGRVAGKQQNSLQQEAVKVEKVQIEEKPVVEEKPVIQQKPVVVQEKLGVLANGPLDSGPGAGAGSRSDTQSAVVVKKEEEVKETGDEYEKDERLELDDNEPEEYGGDYDDKEIEQEDVQEEEEEPEEELEEEEIIDDEEEDGDMVEEEIIEEVAEEIETEEEPERASEEPEHAEVYVEEEDHHDVIKERRKRKEFEVFVGGLDKDATEDDIRKVFSQVGKVTEVRLMMNPLTKKNKGFAFLRFASVEQAKRAVTELKHPVINGKQCGVTPSQDSDTLFLGNICKTWTKEALKEKLKHYGVDNVDDITLVEDSNNEGMNRGFAFLEFSSRSDAMDAFKRLQKRDVLFGVDRPAKVSFADSFIDPGDEIMAQVKTVFIDGLPASWDENRVRELLKKYGEVEKVELARNMPSARRNDFGFVTFDSHDVAVTCAKSINNAELGEGDNKAKVRARLSRPLQRGKGKHVSHGDFRSLQGAGRVVRGPYGRPGPAPLSLSGRGVRGIGSRLSPVSVKRPIAMRDRRPPVMSMPARGRPLPPPRSYERRPPAPSYPKSSLKRDYGQRDELPPPRSRVAIDYGSRAAVERRPPSYRDEYSRSSGYSDIPRSTSRTVARRAYVDDGYSQSFERPPPSYREGRARDYDSISGSKRSYSAMDDVPHRYSDSTVRYSRARMDYELGSASQYGDAYGDRPGRSNMGYGSSQGSMSSQDSRGVYSSRQGMGYGGGSYGGGGGGGDSGMYSSSYGGDYMSRGHDVGGSSYSSLYSGRGMGGSSYMGSGGSGSYY
ncbi:putative RNA binding protein [Tripterygium wilfordii]|uniref:Putative RNA binding protein n=1 Tax=Tripterygium wilfordii TaxID=458696 RepID=A0A7J7CFJ9_TRIWF|nr:heterogeneous nuclear ribonucleoprotein Q-like isoform X2 [Tripterygium wilfordii]KAF5732852.1 putative RNA binding protein [Tripterygium wilfordii]